MKELYDVAVLGLGPSGAVAAHRATKRGLKVLGIDPRGINSPSTVGMWAFQIPAWFPPEAIATRFTPSMITHKGRIDLTTEYVMLKSGWEKHLEGFDVIRDKAQPTARYSWGDDAPTRRNRFSALQSWFKPDPDEQVSVMFDDAPSPGSFTNLLVSTPASIMEARQLARGIVVPESVVPVEQRFAVLMDFSALPGFDEPGPVSFSYRVPLGDGNWLIEETILATTDSPSELLPHLKRKNLARMEHLGIPESEQIGSEVVNFPLGPRSLPHDRPRTRLGLALSSIPFARGAHLDLRFLAGPWGGRGIAGEASIGSAGGWIHPATGYSVGEVLAGTDTMLDRVLAGNTATSMAWRLNYALRHLGLNVLLELNPAQYQEFFSIVLSLPEKDLLGYLNSTDPRVTARVMMKIIINEFKSSPATALTVLKRAPGAAFRK